MFTMRLKTTNFLLKVLLALGCLQSYLLSVSGQATGTKCSTVSGQPGCVCDHPKGKIDLTSLANNDKTPKWTNWKDPNDYTYTFNPCYPYVGGCSDDVFICQKDKSIDDTYYDIAAKGTEEIYTDTDDSIYLYYTEPISGRFARVYLQCDPTVLGDPQFDVKGDSGGVVLHYVFYMKHAHVCPGAAPPSGPGGSEDLAGPIGLVIIFLLLTALAGYFIIGAIVMKFKFQKNGTDIIPNKAFWLWLLSLVKDGVLFTFRPIIGTVMANRYKSQGYSET